MEKMVFKVISKEKQELTKRFQYKYAGVTQEGIIHEGNEVIAAKYDALVRLEKKLFAAFRKEAAQ